MKGKETLTKEKIKCINKVIDKWLGYQKIIKRIPGMSVGIIHKDNIIFSKGYGYENIKTKKPTTDETLYRIASNSKMFTAISIMQLVESEKLRLDDPIVKYLSWLKKDDGMTIRQLLTHSSGINRDGETSHWIDDNFPNIKEIKEHVSKGAMTYNPIEKFKYSNLGYSLLGNIIEEVAGKSYDQYVKENIIEKLNLKDTYPDINEEAENKLATGYGRDIPGVEREIFTNPSTNAMVSATGFISNVLDLCKFMSSQFLENDSLLKSQTKKEMQRIQWVEDKGDYSINWGLGYNIWKVEKSKIIGHGGGFAGFTTGVGFDKEKEIGVALLTNASGSNAFELLGGIFHIINSVSNQYDSPDQEESKINLEKYEGRFHERGGDLEIVEINKELFLFYPENLAPFKELYKLKHKEGDTFIIETGDSFDYIGEEATFNFDKSGKVNRLKVGPNTFITFEEFYQGKKAP
ncbi:MAG: serine hydrolase [Nanoarchaeota archaeon]|nr:serine hydrolase [Nanoarchaeota archaeon]